VELWWREDGKGNLDLIGDGGVLRGYLINPDKLQPLHFRRQIEPFSWVSHKFPDLTLKEAKAVAEALVRLEG
jgi:hypothetical protein